MASISRALSRINQDLRPYLSDQSINDACREAGHIWRERKLGPVKTVHLFVLQVLCFNTAMTHLRHLAEAAKGGGEGVGGGEGRRRRGRGGEGVGSL